MRVMTADLWWWSAAAAVFVALLIVIPVTLAGHAERMSRMVEDRFAVEQAAQRVLARNGYRLYMGRLFRVTVDDPDGWWRGDDLGSVVSAAHAVTRLRREGAIR